MEDASENRWASAAETTSQPVRFTLGTGSQLLSTILPACLEANYEVIIVTCFWAKSQSRNDLSQMLRQLSARALALRARSVNPGRNIRVRLCLSSVSIIQKLLQTNHTNGMVYLPDKWANIGLPDPQELTGLDMVVKSVFVKPFSVMHPKFILIDREKVFMPSCNVSWEDWFEGCVEMKGDVAKEVFSFWKGFWGKRVTVETEVPKHWRKRTTERSCEVPRELTDGFQENLVRNMETPLIPANDPPLISDIGFSLNTDVPTTLLPSPHHKWPHFRPFRKSNPPPTPLNTFILEKVNAARFSIYIQTPNLTCKPFIAAVFDALLRGIDVTIVSSRNLMWLEQIVTAGTITEFEIWKLKRRYFYCAKEYEKSISEDPEAAAGSKPGKLEILYYRPRDGKGHAPGEPVKSHLKLTVFDDKIVVLGSGNQDRASWYTSQELGVAFDSKQMAAEIRSSIQEALKDRVERIL